ncbi:MAG TPA: YhgE/Pip domain-containing protein, partial [Pseudoneobacillus sp.]|nr:YhgE/Pip domain-containing protein [Pseudoneobacillus sp.]
MGTWSWVVNEWKSILKNPKMLIPLLGIMFVPILYSGTYLWAFWDPYAHTERLPVAVVNEDIPVDYKGKTYTIGDDLVDELKKDKSFNWDFVSKTQAEKGIRNNHYFFRIMIPKDFSSRATTLTEQNPTPLMLYYESSLGSNYVASRIGETGIEKLREKLSRTLSENYSKTMFEQLVSVGKGLKDAGESTNQLRSGLTKVMDGTSSIKLGMEEKKESVEKLSKGSKQLSSAASKLADGTAVIQSKMSNVHNGISALENGLNTINNSSSQLNQSVTSLTSGAEQLNDVMSKYSDTHPDLKNDPSFQQMLVIANQLNGGLNKFESAFGKLNSGITETSNSTSSLSDGTKMMAIKMKDISNGANQLATSQMTVSNGTTDLLNGWNKVANSLGTVMDGEKKLIEGSQKLENGLNNGAEEM